MTTTGINSIQFEAVEGAAGEIRARLTVHLSSAGSSEAVAVDVLVPTGPAATLNELRCAAVRRAIEVLRPYATEPSQPRGSAAQMSG